jgi:hypothetical protein
MFLLSRGRVHQCYSIFGTIVNFIYALGIHRQQNPWNKSDLLETEMQKRMFWSAYVTDKYLSSALGRPQMFRDEDIDQQLPLQVEDENLSPKVLKTNEYVLNTVTGIIYQIKYFLLQVEFRNLLIFAPDFLKL